MQRSLYRVLLAISAALIAAIVVISYAMDPFLRDRIEREMNLNMRGYHAGLDHAHLSVLGVLSLRNLTIIQTEHPSPTIIHVPNLRISIKWHDLLRGQIVADCLVAGPDIHLNLIQLRTAASGKIALLPPDWQDALRRLHPFTINHFRMLDANITYIDTDPAGHCSSSMYPLLAAISGIVIQLASFIHLSLPRRPRSLKPAVP